MDSGDCETEEDSAPETCVSPEGPQLPSNSREMRNRAEKMRRDKLNSFISELATLVPMVSRSAKRMDKTSILRLAATYLRIYHTLLNGQNKSQIEIPKQVDQFILEQLVCEQLRGFLLILTDSGKIIFISHTVENLLGHLQTDLMGQSIFNLIPLEDHGKLRMYISPDGLTDPEWRKYFNIRIKRAGPRTESAVYEPVSVMGMQRSWSNTDKGRTNGNCREVATTSSANHEILIFFVKTFRPEPLIDRLMEASKEEYVTRHLVDGRIISCDQRISCVAGYLTEEVSGLSAFNFMHREDVRWVMIALRQMYDREESRGSSCYRLQSKTGEFVYLRTFGYLEIDSGGTVESFVCVNSKVCEKEGKQLIKEMKEKYSALIKTNPETLKSILRSKTMSLSDVEDPKEIDSCTGLLLTNLPIVSERRSTPSPHIHSIENQDCSSSTEYNSPNIPFHIKLKTAAKRQNVSSTDIGTSCSKKRQKRSSSDYSPVSPPQHYQRPKINDISPSGTILYHQTELLSKNA